MPLEKFESADYSNFYFISFFKVKFFIKDKISFVFISNLLSISFISFITIFIKMSQILAKLRQIMKAK